MDDKVTSDGLTRFILEGAGVRGVIARADSAWRQIASHAPYPEPIGRALGECLAASALFAGDIKMAGSIAVQINGLGPLQLAFAECRADGHLRGLARWQEPVPPRLGPQDLGPSATMAITIERDDAAQRHQGLVPLEGEDFACAFERYFERTEQLPTALWLETSGGHCGGLLLQQLPRRSGTPLRAPSEDFVAARAAAARLAPETRAALEPESLLRLAFPEQDVRVFSGIPLSFGCRCSRVRVADVLRTLGRAEAEATLAAEGRIEVVCEFCNRSYEFDRVDLGQIFAASYGAPGTTSVQ
jgi:molecular chaperone Hsp33